jgi:prevent-host-death family protein
MMKTIPQRVLRNESGKVLRDAEAGQQFTITVDGRPVAQLGPVPRRRHWVSKAEVVQLLAQAGRDPGFFDEIAALSEPLARLDERWEPPDR